MNQFTAQDVSNAYENIKELVYQTPLEESLYLSDNSRRYFLKLECQQKKVKAFKLRGALNRMLQLTAEEKTRGVATISSGNHGAAVSYGASLLGIQNTIIIVPEICPQPKVDKIKKFGGTVIKLGKNYDEAHHLGLRYIEDKKMVYIDSYDKDPFVYAGQGTVGLEILKQNPDIDTIVLPIGGGSLSTGVAVAAKQINPSIRIIGVQTDACPAMIRSIEDKKWYDAFPITGDTICDGLVGGVGELVYAMLPAYLTDIISIKETSIRRAVRHLIQKEKIVVEGAGAITVAAVMDYPERIGGKNVALILSGGNIDEDLMMRILNEA